MGMLVIDIGNSRLSWRYRDSAGDLRFGVSSHHAIVDAISDLPPADKIAISSVQKNHEVEIRNWLDRIGRTDALWIRSGADLGSRVLTNNPEQTGADRALCALAWEARSDGRWAVIIDAGTAVTIDAVSPAGQLQGGWIAPGFESIRRALRQAAPDLPDPREMPRQEPAELDTQRPETWGLDSRSAVEGGLHTMFIAGVQALRERVLGGLDDDAVTIVTGGDSWLLVDALQDAVHQPDLVLDGLETMLGEGREI